MGITSEKQQERVPGNGMSKVLVYSLRNRDSSKVLKDMLKAAQKMHWLDSLKGKNKVVIKPNLCYLAPWESGITTNVDTVIALIEYLREIKPDIEIMIVESDSHDRRCSDAFNQLGYNDLENSHQIKVLNLTQSACQEVEIPDIYYTIKIPEIFFEDVFFISIANLKVHLYQKMTGIYKNQFGCVPDEIKERYHQYLEETLYVLNKMIKPDISIIDGKVGLEGIGPVSGSPVKSDIMLMGEDPTAVDTIASKIMGLDPKEVPHLAYAYKKEGTTPDDYTFEGVQSLPNLNFQYDRAFKLVRTKIKITRFTNSWNKRYKNFATRVYNIPHFTKRAYGFGKRKLRKVVGK
jgi:uncharacterized protein (DUF362 family)